MGVLPELSEWKLDTKYRIEKQEILNKKDIELSETDLDLARIKGQDITEIKKDRLQKEKKRLLKELNEKYGIADEEEPKILPEDLNLNNDPKKLWEMLQGKGIVKKDKKNG